jgi:hypothetical protein
MSQQTRLNNLSKTTRRFFQRLQERRWKDAEAAIKNIQRQQTNRSSKLVKGYMNALQGMLIAKRYGHASPTPFILTLDNPSLERLKELRNTFKKQSREKLNAAFDRGFFTTWYEYIEFVMDKASNNEEDKHQVKKP